MIALAKRLSAWTQSRGRNSSHVRPMRKSDQRLQKFAENAEQTARRQRDIQEEVDRADKAATGIKDKKLRAMQAGARASRGAIRASAARWRSFMPAKAPTWFTIAGNVTDFLFCKAAVE